MKIINYIKENGLKHVFEVIYRYKMDKIILMVMKPFLANKPLKDMIVIESHNDFDSNGGAFYNYLIKNNYHKKYKIVWLLKHQIPEKLPENVVAVPLYKPSIKKNYYRLAAKWFTSDNDCISKCREDQTAIYFGHGGFGLKNFKGLIEIPQSIDFIAMPSHYLKEIFSEQMMMQPDDPRACYIGFPYIDNFYNAEKGDLDKITNKVYKKVVLWMPTFRKGGGHKRQDSVRIGKLGIPLIQNEKAYSELNEVLKTENMLLIIKIHPMQDISDLGIGDMSNIKVLTGETVKELEVDNYRLMKDCDALISDYSSAAYDFLHRNKPIAYDFSDIEDYKRGLCVENPLDYIAGDILKTQEDFFSFIQKIGQGVDDYYNERQILRRKIFDYYDGDNCRRAVELLKIGK